MMTTDLRPRISFLQGIADREDVVLPDHVARYIAEWLTPEPSALEGVLMKLIAYASQTNQEISLELAKASWRSIIGDDRLTMSLREANADSDHPDDPATEHTEQRLERCRRMPNDRKGLMRFVVRHEVCPGEMNVVGTPVDYGLEVALRCPGCGASITAIIVDRSVFDRMFDLAKTAGIVETCEDLEALTATEEGWDRLDAIIESPQVQEVILATVLEIQRDEPKH